MNKIEFYFKDLKPITQNHAVKHKVIKKGRKNIVTSYKSDIAKVYEQTILIKTASRRPDIFDFEANYSPYEHFLACHIHFYMPKNKLITSKGYVNNKSIDLDNSLKYLIDAIFKRFNKIDDSAICQITSYKSFSTDKNYNTYISLIRQDLEILEDY